jgi:hypothetical protein
MMTTAEQITAECNAIKNPDSEMWRDDSQEVDK